MRRIPYLALSLVLTSCTTSRPALTEAPKAGGGGYHTLAAPAAPHVVTVFPQRDFVSLTGYAPGEQIKFEVFRADLAAAGALILVGSASGTADSAGVLEANHPGGLCWDAAFDQTVLNDPDFKGTPDILPGDVVRITSNAGATVEETTVSGVRCGLPAAVPQPDGTTDVVIHGVALDQAGVPLPTDQIEERLVNPNRFILNGKRAVSATAAGADGVLTYDDPTSGRWTARYRNVGTDVTALMEAESRVLWLGADPLALTELTIYENPGAPGPFQFGCGVFALNAITSPANGYVANISRLDRPIVLDGVAEPNATSVSLTIGNETFANIVPTGCGPQKTWHVETAKAASLLGLSDGENVITPRFTLASRNPDGTVGTRVINGAPFYLTKDFVAPDVTATPSTATVPVTVTLSSSDPTATIYYTTDNTPASAASTRYVGPLALATPTKLRFVAVDPAGNVSPEGTSNYGAAPGDVTPPVITAQPAPALGQVLNASQPITLSLNEPGAIFYGLGAAPTTPVTGPIFLPNGTTTLNVKAIDSANNVSTASYTFTVDAIPPTISAPVPWAPPPTVTRLRSTAGTPGLLSISAEAGADIFYTTDGSDPTDPLNVAHLVNGVLQGRIQTTNPGTISVPRPANNSGNGTITVKVVAKDAAGNYSQPITGLYRF
jgi:hypothetical protein